VFADLASFVGYNKLRLDKPSAASIVANCRRCCQGCSLPASAAAVPTATAAAVDTPPPLPSTAVAIVANRDAIEDLFQENVCPFIVPTESGASLDETCVAATYLAGNYDVIGWQLRL
jgi:hypothetical protein